MAQIVKMPDGTKVSFPDDMPKEEIAALIAHKFPDAVKGAAQANKPKDFGSEAVDYVSQGLSGINEGIANAMSLPASLARTALSVGPVVSNTLLGTKFSTDTSYVPDPGAEANKLMTTTGAIKPPSTEPGKKFVRRVGQEVGAVATLGGPSSIPSAIGAGIGAATANAIAPDNPYAEMAGEVVGGLGPSIFKRILGNLTASKVGPTADELQTMKNAAYKEADNLGVKYSPQAYKSLETNIDNAVAADNISATRHPKAFSFVEDLAKRGQGGLTLTELDQLRQEVRRDLLRSGDEAEQHFGKVIIGQIDDFISKASAADVVGGSAPDAAQAITTARELNTRFRKTELIEDALYRAQMRAASAGSGGNINNTIRQEFRKILFDDTERSAFSPDEIKSMEAIVKQGKGEELLRLVGKLSPSGNGLMTALGIGAVAVNPGMAALPVAGAVAKTAADKMTVGKAAALRAAVARGNGPSLSLLTPDILQKGAALSAGMIANDNAAALRAARVAGP